MTERTIIAVVSDLIKTGLTVEQQILVNELALVVADAQRSHDDREAQRASWRDSQRRHRTSCDTPHTPLDKTNIKKISPLTPLAEPLFDQFWDVYPLKVGKGAARKAFRHALVRGSAEEITAGAKRYAASKPDPKFTKHPSTWLNADCWLDEGKVLTFRASTGPQRSYAEIKAERESNTP